MYLNLCISFSNRKLQNFKQSQNKHAKKLICYTYSLFVSDFMNNLCKYSGSGVLVIDIATDNVLLVYDYSGNYNCCGGFLKYNFDDPQFLEKTAQEELYEETRMLINCNLDELAACPFIDLPLYEDIFRCYILKIRCQTDICEQFEKTFDEDYFETTALAFFSIEQFRNRESMEIIEQTFQGLAHDGTKCNLNKRAIAAIKTAIQSNLL